MKADHAACRIVHITCPNESLRYSTHKCSEKYFHRPNDELTILVSSIGKLTEILYIWRLITCYFESSSITKILNFSLILDYLIHCN